MKVKRKSTTLKKKGKSTSSITRKTSNNNVYDEDSIVDVLFQVKEAVFGNPPPRVEKELGEYAPYCKIIISWEGQRKTRRIKLKTSAIDSTTNPKWNPPEILRGNNISTSADVKITLADNITPGKKTTKYIYGEFKTNLLDICNRGEDFKWISLTRASRSSRGKNPKVCIKCTLVDMMESKENNIHNEIDKLKRSKSTKEYYIHQDLSLPNLQSIQCDSESNDSDFSVDSIRSNISNNEKDNLDRDESGREKEIEREESSYSITAKQWTYKHSVVPPILGTQVKPRLKGVLRRSNTLPSKSERERSPKTLRKKKSLLLLGDESNKRGIVNKKEEKNLEFQALFHLPEDTLLSDYAAGFYLHFALIGRLYLSKNNLCFYTELYGCVKVMEIIPFKEITRLEPDRDSTIKVITRQRKYLFFIMGTRDRVLEVARSIWFNHGGARSQSRSVSEENVAYNTGIPSRSDSVLSMNYDSDEDDYMDGDEEELSGGGSGIGGVGGRDSINPLSRQRSLSQPERYHSIGNTRGGTGEQISSSNGLTPMGGNSGMIRGKGPLISNTSEGTQSYSDLTRKDSSSSSSSSSSMNQIASKWFSTGDYKPGEFLKSISKHKIIHQSDFEDLSVVDFFIKFWSGERVALGFYEVYHAARRSKELQITNWTMTIDGSVEREVKFKAPVSARMGPSECVITENQRFHLRRHLLIIDISAKTTGIPYADSFIVEHQWRVTERDMGAGGCVLNIRGGVHWIKKPYLISGTIESTTVKELKDAISHFTRTTQQDTSGVVSDNGGDYTNLMLAKRPSTEIVAPPNVSDTYSKNSHPSLPLIQTAHDTKSQIKEIVMIALLICILLVLVLMVYKLSALSVRVHMVEDNLKYVD